MSSAFPEFLVSQLTNSAPYLLIYAGCLVCGICLRSRAPKAAILAVLGLAILFAMSLFGSLATAYCISLQVDGGIPVRQMGYVFMGLGILRAVGHAIGFGLVFAAVFVGRSTQDNRTPIPPPLS